LRNALARGTPDCRKWHPRVVWHPGWEPLLKHNVNEVWLSTIL